MVNDNDTSCEPSISPFLLAARFLLPISSDPNDDDKNWRRAACWFVFWGLLIGLFYAALFGVVWKYYGEQQRIRFMPAVALLAVDFSFLGYRLIQGVACVAGKPRGPASDALTLPVLMAVVFVALLKVGVLFSLPYGAQTYPAQWWHGSVLHWLYPPVMYRPLILMALWGRWGVVLALRIGRCASGTPKRLRFMAEGYSLRVVIAQWVLLTALTTAYCSAEGRHLPWGLLMSLGVMVGTYLTAFVLSLRQGGQTEASVLASGAVAELVFLLLYLPFASYIYWY